MKELTQAVFNNQPKDVNCYIVDHNSLLINPKYTDQVKGSEHLIKLDKMLKNLHSKYKLQFGDNYSVVER